MGVQTESDGSAQASALIVALRAPTGPHPLGVVVPVGVEVGNDSPREVWMVGVVDGSEEGVRYPQYSPSVTRGASVVAAPPPPEDPLVGPLRAVDFRRLRPGESFDPTRGEGGAAYQPLSTFATFRPAEPGVYRYALTVSTESVEPEEWLGRFGQDAERSAVLNLVARVPRVTVTATVDVDVR